MAAKKQIKKLGPFTWVNTTDPREEGFRAECWTLQVDPDMPTTHWCVKNYGGEPGPGFHGWKLVSGGPFDSAGAYSNLDDAIKGVTPWLIARYKEDAERELAKAEKTLAALKRFKASVDKL